MPPTTTPPPKAKSRGKLASGLVFTGMTLFGLEQFGLSKIAGPTKSVHLDPNLLSVLVVAPILLVIAGAVVFMVGRMGRR